MVVGCVQVTSPITYPTNSELILKIKLTLCQMGKSGQEPENQPRPSFRHPATTPFRTKHGKPAASRHTTPYPLRTEPPLSHTASHHRPAALPLKSTTLRTPLPHRLAETEDLTEQAKNNHPHMTRKFHIHYMYTLCNIWLKIGERGRTEWLKPESVNHPVQCIPAVLYRRMVVLPSRAR